MNSLEDFKAMISSTITGSGSPEEVLSHLDKMGIEWYVTEEGTLMIKYWQVGAEDFMAPEHAAVIRATNKAPEQGAELDWVSKNLDRLRQEYGGNWIAVSDLAVIASSPDLPNLMLQIKEFENPFTTFIPADSVVWNFAYAF